MIIGQNYIFQQSSKEIVNPFYSQVASPICDVKSFLSECCVKKHINNDMESGRKKPRSWSEIEDQRLIQAVSIFGPDKWIMISNYVGGGRTKSQCNQRWSRGLDPRLNKMAWTKEEDGLLLNLVLKYGTKSWTKVASGFVDRCDVQCRYRYSQLKKSGKFYSNHQDDSNYKLPTIWSLIDPDLQSKKGK